MSNFGYGNDVVPITEKDQIIPYDLWNPHYSDRRFTDRTSDGLTIFADQATEIVPTQIGGEADRSLSYDYSDRIASFIGSEALRTAMAEAEKVVGNNRSARYLEHFLRNAFDDQDLWLGHVKAGVNRSNGHPYQLYGYRIS